MFYYQILIWSIHLTACRGGSLLDWSDKKVQCFVGSHSAWDNLHLIPAGQYPRLNSLKESDRSFILGGLEGVLSSRRLDYTWEMIWRRWQVYENLRNQR